MKGFSLNRKVAIVLLLIAAVCAVPVAATTLVFFHEIGCTHCASADAFLASIQPDYPELEILHYEIGESESLELLAGLLVAYGVKQDSVPMIFIGDVAWIGGTFFGLYEEPYTVSGRAADMTLEIAIQRAIEAEAMSPLDRIEETDTSTLAEGLTIPAIIIAAAIDSVNPCTFAVLVLLLGTLIVAQRNGKKGLVLKAGLAFTIAIYISYFLLGIGVFTAIQAAGVQKPFIIVVSSLAILLGLWNMKDFFAYGKWFSIEVPKRWRPMVKKLTSSVVSIPGAFFVGVLDSLFLLPCSSGPYIAILALLSKNSSKVEGLWYLALYNLIFILPLLLITFAVHFGYTTTARAERWRSARLGKLHLLSGILMLLLGAGMLTAVLMGWL
jgi:cytochrome c biogenesis protein CcdA/glutaredoxin